MIRKDKDKYRVSKGLPPKACSAADPIELEKMESPKPAEKELDRYPARVFLCAYMILGQPEGVFSTGSGQRELALSEAAARLIPEFEALMGYILDGSRSTPAGPSSPNGSPQKRSRSEWPSETTAPVPSFRPFAAQLAAFDAAWCAYLYHFVAWKVKDARVLEEEMTRMACQLEVSMLQKCKFPGSGDVSVINPDVQAIRTQVLHVPYFDVNDLSAAIVTYNSPALCWQVLKDQKLLQDRIIHLTGKAGVKRLEEALREARAKHAEAIAVGTPIYSPFVTLTNTQDEEVALDANANPANPLPAEGVANPEIENKEKPKVVKPQSTFPPPIRRVPISLISQDATETQEISSNHQSSELTNEHIVNEMLHDAKWQLKNGGTSPSGPELSSASKRLIEIQVLTQSISAE